MKFCFTILSFVTFSLSAHAGTNTLIARCSYDAIAGKNATGAFKAGTALAHVYRKAAGEPGLPLVVAHGISLVDGNINNKKDVLQVGTLTTPIVPTEADQGALWPVYEFDSLQIDDTHVVGRWTDNLARSLNPEKPVKSGMGADLRNLGHVQAVTGLISYLQSFVVRPGTVYPYCIFWERP